MFILLFLSSFLNQASSNTIEPINFTFSSFNSDSCGAGGRLICSGIAAAGDGYVDLTPGSQQTNSSTLAEYRVGRILYEHPVLAWPAVISTTFTVRISKDPNSVEYGDGMAFVMAQDNSSSPVGSYGSYLGLFNQTTEGKITHLLAVELDTFKNEYDIDSNHVGIDTTSRESKASVTLNSTGVELKSGRDIRVKIYYDGWIKELQVYVGYSGGLLVSVLNHTIIMKETVPKKVYVGFTGSTGTRVESHQVLNWVFDSAPLPPYTEKDQSNTFKTVLIFIFPIITGFLLLGTCIYPAVRKWCHWKTKEIEMTEDIESRSRSAANSPKMFTLKQLLKATNNFNKDNLLGTGGFGSVYRGFILNPPSTIAVKKISATSKQGEREYFAEICTIGRLRHKNILQLQGWCHERDQLLLVYEYMPNGSLDRFICNGSLDWNTRYKILIGLASALLYLHEECGNTVVHRDVKPNNVMLDSDFNAHLGDFGLARLLQNETSVTTMLAGTPGYLAPECSYTCKATPESDVFSFGIVVLEVVCGRRSMSAVGENNLVDYVWSLHGKDEFLQCVDQKLEGKVEEGQAKRALAVGLVCSHPDPVLRPTIRKVVQVFMNPEEPLMELPKSRPNAIYIPIHSPVLTTNGVLSTNSGSCLSMPLPDETTICQYGR